MNSTFTNEFLLNSRIEERCGTRYSKPLWAVFFLIPSTEHMFGKTWFKVLIPTKVPQALW